MVRIKCYEDIDVELLQATENPHDLIIVAAAMTQKKDYFKRRCDVGKLVDSLVKARHTSLLEHVVYTFEIRGASRSFLAQATRHRMASYTSGSQQYQEYGCYGFNIDSALQGETLFKEAYQASMDFYNKLLEAGIPKEEARQVLPNGIENNLLMTINARSLINFFNQRLCKRNVKEMQEVASRMYKLVKPHFPELWRLIGPDCYMESNCTQGKLSCGEKWSMTDYAHN